MAKPDHFKIVPKPHQLKGAVQINYACNGPFHGMVLADPQDFGRRAQAVLAIHLAKDVPGKTLVVVPEYRLNHPGSAADHWLEKFRKSWEQVCFNISGPIPFRSMSPFVQQDK